MKRFRGVCAASVPLAVAGMALAQSSEPAVFVGNNGNLEGSVTSFLVEPDGALTFVEEVDANTNAFSIGLSPDGSLLAVGRASDEDVTEELRIFSVNGDATLDLVLLTQVPNTPIDLAWVSDEILAVLETDIEAGNYTVRTYAFDDAGLAEVDVEPTGGFTTSLAVSADGSFLYTGRSLGGNQIRAFSVDTAGEMELVQTLGTPIFPLDLTLGAGDGALYIAGGISGNGDKIGGYSVDTGTGMLSALKGSPFVSPGDSPAHLTPVGDDLFVAGHGSDATLQSFTVDGDGALTATGFSYDVGFQGSLGDVASGNGLLFATDETAAIDGVAGVLVFQMGGDGAFKKVAGPVDTQGIAPMNMAVWTPAPACEGDTNGDGAIDSADLNTVLGAFGRKNDGAPDVSGDGLVDATDLNIVLGAFGERCD